MNTPDRYLADINRYHERVQNFFYASVPGALGVLYYLTLGGVGERMINSVQTNISQVKSGEMIPLAIAFGLWALPFELAEHNMTKLKQSLRDYKVNSENRPLPIRYTLVDYFVNTVMKIAFDKSPMPSDSES